MTRDDSDGDIFFGERDQCDSPNESERARLPEREGGVRKKMPTLLFLRISPLPLHSLKTHARNRSIDRLRTRRRIRRRWEYERTLRKLQTGETRYR